MNLETFSKHLFWDVERSSLDHWRNADFIIRRVIQYGTIDDWRSILCFYGIARIGEACMTAADLDRRSASFVALLANLPKEKFKCYATRQSMQKHWIC